MCESWISAFVFLEAKRVDADFGTHVVATDQSVEHGGEGTEPEPFDLFLASIGTCAGLYVLGFCQARGISTEAIQILQRNDFDTDTHVLKGVELQIVLPPTFPEKYRVAIVRAAEGCKVRKALATQPVVTVTSKIASGKTAA